MNKLINILILTLMCFALIGCGKPQLYQEDVIDCVQGEYALEKDVANAMKLEGKEAKHYVIYKMRDTCHVGIELKKEIDILGNKMKILPQTECSISCVVQLKQQYSDQLNDSMIYHNALFNCCS